MYSQMVNTDKFSVSSKADKKFQERIDNGEKIEPLDYMPEAYIKTLIRQISQHAHSEVVGMLPEANWITRAPSLNRKIILLAKVQDEAGHGLYLYSAVETLGVSREDLVSNLLAGKAKYSSIFNYPTLTWADIGAIGFLVDGAAIVNQVSLCGTSYGPYSRALIRICKEESFHQRQGFDILWKLTHGNEKQMKLAQESIDRLWWPSLMMFGPHDSDSVHSNQSLEWKIKRHSNDALRQKFINQTIPQLDEMGLKVPDPDLKWDSKEKKYIFGQIDWKEFYAVLDGKGKCNKERLQAINKSSAEGLWVREAAKAYAEKDQTA